MCSPRKMEVPQKENPLLKNPFTYILAASLVLILLLPTTITFALDSWHPSTEVTTLPFTTKSISNVPDDPIPLSRISFVAEDPNSYFDEFSYIAAIPGSLFYSGGTQYISPLIYAAGTDSERWLLEDWTEYLLPDGGLSELVIIGDIPISEIKDIQEVTGTKAYPQITGGSSAEVAAKLAVKDWRSAGTVVLALAKDSFAIPTVTSGSASYSFNGVSISSYDTSVTIGSTIDTEISFTPPAGIGWMKGSFNWTGSEIFTHTLKDPLGRSVDYSVYRQVIFERNVAYVESPLPLYFWMPLTTSGEWNMILEPRSQITRDIAIDCSVTYFPGFSQSITVPHRSKWLNVTTMWDNAGTTINLALVDPNGRMVMWSPAESLLGGSGSKAMEMPYPAPGEWHLIGAWVDATGETNNVNMQWNIETLPDDLQPYLESASNGAVLASLLNAPLLYVDAASVPAITEWALEYLGASTCFLVDPSNFHSSTLVDELDDFLFVSVLSTYSSVTSWIHTLSGELDVVLTLPLGNADELFPPAAYCAAYHGAAIYSLCGEDNLIPTRSEETWAPYLIGPDIRIFVQNQFSARTENGWYDERIPNIYSMQYSATAFESFLNARGAYNSSAEQSAIIVSPTDLIKVSFDRSLQSHFACGRFPSDNPALTAAMVNRASLHRFLYMTANNANEALLSLYAYTYSSTPYPDNFGTTHIINQITASESALTTADFTIRTHVGVNEVFAAVASQVGLWSFSTHGTLTEYPTDPPQRPNGLGVFSIRDEDIAYGQETDSERDYGGSSGDGIVNPVLYSPESNHHILRTTYDLESSIDNIGSPIVIITACLLGGSELPLMLMKHGAVAVTAAPRTVYFRAAGLLSIMFTEAISSGNTTGDALAYALRAISYDYTNPISGEPNDYANQQVLFGDPDICLFNPENDPRISSATPCSISIDGHTPCRGVKGVAVLGTTDYLQTGLDALSVEYDYYDSLNYSEFLTLLDLRRTVIIEPLSISSLSDTLDDNPSALPEFVYNGGVLVMMGINTDISWVPWDIVFVPGSDSSIDVLDTGHPLVSIPNTLPSDFPSEGSFSSVSENISILATNSAGIAIAAGIYGGGKVALTTVVPSGTNRDLFLENIISWDEQGSLLLWEITKSQEIIWEGDRVVLTLLITNIAGQPVDDVSLTFSVNSSEIAVSQTGIGTYEAPLSEAWTSGKAGYHSLEIHATKSGYDTLSLVLTDFLLIRTSPLLLILIGSGIIVTIVIGWQYWKFKHGGSSPKERKYRPPTKETKEERRKRELAEKERKRKREEEEKRFDAKEYFGVE